jgi:hypothetical protein
MGSGKTTVLGEASDILATRGIAHAVLDLDMLGTAYMPDVPSGNGVMYRNLAAVWANYTELGIVRLLLARAFESEAELQQCREAVPDAHIVICRLRAEIKTMQQRVRAREHGVLQETYVARVTELEASLDLAGLEHFSVNNEGRSVTQVAEEMLVRAGWL